MGALSPGFSSLWGHLPGVYFKLFSPFLGFSLLAGQGHPLVFPLLPSTALFLCLPSPGFSACIFLTLFLHTRKHSLEAGGVPLQLVFLVFT